MPGSGWPKSAGRPVPPQATADQLVAALGGPLPDGPHRPGRGRRPARRGCRARPDGDARPAGSSAGSSAARCPPRWPRTGWPARGTRTPACASPRPARRRPRRSRPAGCSTCSGCPPTSAVGFVTGGTMANFTGLAAGRQQRAHRRRLGPRPLRAWPAHRGSRVLVGADRHDHGRPRAALPRPRRADRGRRRRPGPDPPRRAGRGARRRRRADHRVPAGRQPALRRVRPDRRGDRRWPTSTAPGCTSTAPSGCGPPRRRGCATWSPGSTPPTRGRPTRTRRSTCPYDCGIAIVRDPAELRAAMGMQASYLVHADERGDPLDQVPELSRRARGVPVWAALRSLGPRRGGRPGRRARRPRAGHRRRHRRDRRAPRSSTTSSSPRCAPRSATTSGPGRSPPRLLADGTAWMSGSRWRGRDVLRVSVSNWSTDAADVTACVDAVRRAAAGT